MLEISHQRSDLSMVFEIEGYVLIEIQFFLTVHNLICNDNAINVYQ